MLRQKVKVCMSINRGNVSTNPNFSTNILQLGQLMDCRPHIIKVGKGRYIYKHTYFSFNDLIVNFHYICIQNIACQRYHCSFFLFPTFEYFVHFDVSFIHASLFRNANKRRYLIHWFDCLTYSVPCVLLVGKACMTSNLQLLNCTSCRVVTYDDKQYSCEDIRGHRIEQPLDGYRLWCARQSLERNCDYLEGYVSEISYWSKVGVS